jgi:hypothetical protein
MSNLPGHSESKKEPSSEGSSTVQLLLWSGTVAQAFLSIR